MNPDGGPSPLTIGGPGPVDPDTGLVARARGGDLGAFEDLVRRHARCVYRTVVGITGHDEDAEDAMQTAFMKAFQRLDEFRGTARFSTWLVRIAINEALDKVRGRRTTEPLEWETSDSEDDDRFRPRRLDPWAGDPEQLHARAETRALVEQAILALPPKYRVPVLLRDMEQMTTEEAAAATGLPIPTLKTRLLRGRLLLRESLAPHFASRRRD
jgi:RNA polymerase sigma-70 factor (ECF subfamily)